MAVTGAYSIAAFASATLPTDDIVLKLLAPDGRVVASSDTATSPEAVTYSVDGGRIPDGTYHVVVCRFDAPTVPASGPNFGYSGGYAINTAAGAPSTAANPSWKFFAANPQLSTTSGVPFDSPSTDTRVTACYLSAAGCDLGLNSTASRGPWDSIPSAGVPSFTTEGNAARTAEARTSPLTPGATGFMPTSPTRQYQIPFANEWYASKCDPASLAVPGSGADISAAVGNLFSGHNRFHDFAYHLGFTELNYNLQQSNFGATAPGPYPAGREADPELGDVQAGAVTGGQPTFEGRDNANQIALDDGVPGITNQYLFQPIAGAFYSPCVDGDFDTSVFGHEYTHAISNRMVGGPDDGLTGLQGGAMGESWSDLVALEYLHAHGYVPVDGESPWAEGAYVTGNKQTGIRDYALELRCADGRPGSRAPEAPLPAEQCPGDRRWVQILFDAFLLQQGDTSMLTARDAYLAADRMRFVGANQATLWSAFAHRGMGRSAATNTNEDDQPRPGFDSPLADKATVTFATTDAASGKAIPSTFYVGRYEARDTPVADTVGSTPPGASAKLVPGSYDVFVQSAGHGLRRFKLTVGAGTNQQDLIDDEESTTWDVAGATGVDASKPAVTVSLAGVKAVRSIGVSAMLDPTVPDADEGRFTALRRFSVETCDGRRANCTQAASWKTLYTSPAAPPQPGSSSLA